MNNKPRTFLGFEGNWLSPELTKIVLQFVPRNTRTQLLEAFPSQLAWIMTDIAMLNETPEDLYNALCGTTCWPRVASHLWRKYDILVVANRIDPRHIISCDTNEVAVHLLPRPSAEERFLADAYEKLEARSVRIFVTCGPNPNLAHVAKRILRVVNIVGPCTPITVCVQGKWTRDVRKACKNIKVVWS